MNWRRYVASLVMLVGCTSAARQDPDSETHWLALCETDDDCPGAGRCLCGVCTVECTGACSLKNTRCVETTDERCGTLPQPDTAQFCAAECETSADCRAGQRCASGACVARAASRTSGAAAPGSAGSNNLVPGAGGTPATPPGAGGASAGTTAPPMVDAGGMTGGTGLPPPPAYGGSDAGSVIGFTTPPR